MPQLPDLTADVEDSISWQEVWTPPQARVLCRYLHHASQRYLFANHDRPPSGSSLDFALGSVRGFPLAGTTSLIVRDDSNGDGPAFALGEPADIDDTELVGFVEQAPLPGFDPLQIGRHRASGQKILLAGTHDPLAGAVDELVGIGYIEAYPIHPRQLPPPSHIDIPYGLAGLVRTLDLGARRHRYGVGDTPAGVFAGELGALLTGPGGDCEPIWISADGLLLEDNRPDRPNGRPSLATAIRWAADPLTWSGAGRLMPRVRAAGRRAYESGRILASKPVQRPSPSAPTGYLLRSPTTQTIPLYSATHPVTGDRLLSTLEAEADELGYGNVKLIGHLVDLAFVTDTLGVVRHAMPWASNFGRVIGGS